MKSNLYIIKSYLYTDLRESEEWNYSKSGNSWKYPDLWTDLFPPKFFICIKLNSITIGIYLFTDPIPW